MDFTQILDFQKVTQGKVSPPTGPSPPTKVAFGGIGDGTFLVWLPFNCENPEAPSREKDLKKVEIL